MKKYIKKFNKETEYENWLSTQKSIQIIEIGSISDETRQAWFSTNKDLYVVIPENDFEEPCIYIKTKNSDAVITSNCFLVSFFKKYENCIIIPYSIINSYKWDDSAQISVILTEFNPPEE